MVERITREGDRNIYQPKIHAERISELYKVKLITGLPLTVLVDEAIRQYVSQYENTVEWKKLSEVEENHIDNEIQNNLEQEDENRWEETEPWEDGSMYGY
jgi:hypothetical protein